MKERKLTICKSCGTKIAKMLKFVRIVGRKTKNLFIKEFGLLFL